MISVCTWKILAKVLNYLVGKALTKKKKLDSESDFINSAVHVTRCFAFQLLWSQAWVNLITFFLK